MSDEIFYREAREGPEVERIMQTVIDPLRDELSHLPVAPPKVGAFSVARFVALLAGRLCFIVSSATVDGLPFKIYAAKLPTGMAVSMPHDPNEWSLCHLGIYEDAYGKPRAGIVEVGNPKRIHWINPKDDGGKTTNAG